MILITGASGFLGKSILDFFSSKDISILSLGRNSLNDIKCDLSSEIPNLNLTEIELVIHAAGKAHSIPKNQLAINRFFEVNVIGTQNLLKGLALAGVPKQFVFISSVAVYGLNEGNKINENSPLLAIDPYGLSKIQAERVVIDWCYKNNVVCTILRLPLLVGKNPPGNLGAMIKAIHKGYYFNIGGGKAIKSMVLAEDVVRFIPIIASVGGIYNLTDGEHPNFMYISNAIAKKKMYNLPLLIAKIMGYLGDCIGEKAPINSLKIKKITTNLAFDDSKARRLGWKSQSVLEYLKNNDLL
jgi:nucleoside-diphosphate-sugar epimerase